MFLHECARNKSVKRNIIFSTTMYSTAEHSKLPIKLPDLRIIPVYS
jgi:hypothetical protein